MAIVSGRENRKIGSRLNSEILDLFAPAHLKLVRFPAHSPLPNFTLITRTAPCLRQLPSCVAVYPRDTRSRRVLCRFPQKLHSTSRFAHLCRSRPRGSVREHGISYSNSRWAVSLRFTQR
jgi:hypothetical protein